MINFIFILLLFIFQKDPLYNKEGRPSSWGINLFVKNNEQSLIKEYEYLVDSLYDIAIFTEDLGEDGDLGEFYIPDQIVITNREKFIDYEFKSLSKFKQRTVSYTERTVKAVIFHEITHAYFNQEIYLMKDSVFSEYMTLRMFPNPSTQFGAEFIEEGVCEYIVYYLNESAAIGDIFIPENIDDLLDPLNRVNITYVYSVLFLKDFLDKKGFQKGIEILISNKPPSYEEILNPELYFNRLK